MTGRWYARPVLAVTDAAAALDFYVDKLGFREDWRHVEEDRLRIAQVSRSGCEIILSDQWPSAAGMGRTFISLDRSTFASIQQEFADRNVPVTQEWWGYPLLVVRDLDGNQLWFPEPDA